MNKNEIVLAENNSTEGLIPGEIESFISLHPSDRKGYRFRQFYFEHPWTQHQLKQLYYGIYRKHSWTRTMVDKIAKFAISVGFDIKYTGTNLSDKRSAMLMKNFFKYPNFQESWEDVLFKTVVQLKLFGSSYWEIVENSMGYPVDFYILDGAILPQFDEHGSPKSPAYIQRVLGETCDFEYNEVMWFKFPDPIGKLLPSSPLEPVEASILLDMYAIGLNKRQFTQGVRKGKAFIFPENTGEEAMKRNKAQIDQMHEGLQGSYKPFLALEGECKIEDLELQETKMEAKDLREFLRDELAAVIGTPVSKLGIESTDVKESQFIDRTFYNEEIRPLLKMIENTINRYLDLVGIFDYRFCFKKVNFTDIKEMARVADVLKKHGAVSINEVREMFGLSAKENADADRTFIVGKGGMIIFTDALESTIEKTNSEALALPYSFKIGKRKLIKNTGELFPAADDNAVDIENLTEEEREDLQEKLENFEEDEANPFR